MKHILSIRSVKKLLEDASPGPIQQEAVIYMREQLEEYTKQMVPYARQICFLAGRKQLSKKDLELALKKP
jgi:histone H3/H4